MKRWTAAVFVALLMLGGCAKKKHLPAATPPRVGAVEEGVASWYGHPYHGRRAANGEIYDMEKLTAAHRTLPFETIVRVRNLSNDLTVDVRVTDRGPFVDGRIIDLSRAAAKAIHMIGPGTARVQLRILALPSELPAGFYAVQTGAFRERENAERQRAEMERRYGTAMIEIKEASPPLWRVLVGRAGTIEEAGALAARVQNDGGAAFVVRVERPGDN